MITESQMLQSRFKEITKLFYQGQYQQGYSKIQNLAHQNPKNSILYANKGLFLSQLGNEGQAIQNLQLSLELNPINYVAYFNLFSIQARNNLENQAFANLCCALSVMYLIRARINKNINDLRKSLLLASNNIEASVLLSLMSLKMGKYQYAKQVIQGALIITPRSPILEKLHQQVSKYLDPQHSQDQFSKTKASSQNSRKRLKCSIQFNRDFDLVRELNQKLDQFNFLYNQINGSFGGITQKVKKESSFFNPVETFMLQKSRAKQTNGSAIALLQDEQYFITKSTQKETQASQQKKREESLEAAQSLVTAYQSTHNKDISVIQEAEQDRLSLESQPANLPQKNRFDLYPLSKYNLFRMNVIKLMLFQFENQGSFQSVYCIISYGSWKNKMITSAIPCLQGECLWNKIFDDIQLEKQPANLKFKIYNKKRNQIRDQFIGDFQVLLITADLLKLPVLNREGEQVGTLLLHVQMNGSSND